MRTSRIRGPWAALTLGLLCALIAQSPPSIALAQANPQWLIVPSIVADGGDVSTAPRRTADLLERAAPSGGFALIPAMQARARFEQRGSSAPMLATHSDLDALARDAQQALYHVASGLPTRARQDVERALARAGNVIESLNRETRAAQHLLDACLYLVRAQLESGQRDEAREQALQCRRLVPDIEPDGTMHPPDVIGVLAEAEAHLRQREPGSLRVESSPTGCSVYVNGRMLGTSPLELPDLSPGEYRVQVECREGQPGRVHRTVLAAGRVVKRIDTRLDSVLQTTIDTSVQYGSYGDQTRFAVDHATEIGRIVGASDVLVVTQVSPTTSGDSTMLVRRIHVADGKVMAAVRIVVNEANEVAHGHRDQAWADLRNESFSDLTQADGAGLAASEYEVEAPVATVVARVTGDAATTTDVAVLETPEDASSVPPKRISSGPSVFGWVLGGAGAAALITGWSLYGYQLKLEADYQLTEYGTTPYFQALNRIDSFQFAPLVTTLVGVALISASMPWILPTTERFPAWSLVVGGVGLAAAGVGAYFLYEGSACEEFDRTPRCTNTLSVTYFGGMLLMMAAPLLTIPIVYMTRGAGVADSQVTVSATQQSLGLQWSGVM